MFEQRVRAGGGTDRAKSTANALHTAIRQAAGSDKTKRRALLAKIVAEFGFVQDDDDVHKTLPGAHAVDLNNRKGAALPLLRATDFEAPKNTERPAHDLEKQALDKAVGWLKTQLEKTLKTCGTAVWNPKKVGSGFCQSPVGKPLPPYEVLVRGSWQPVGVFETRSGNVLHDFFKNIPQMMRQQATANARAALVALEYMTAN